MGPVATRRESTSEYREEKIATPKWQTIAKVVTVVSASALSYYNGTWLPVVIASLSLGVRSIANLGDDHDSRHIHAIYRLGLG